MKLQEAIKNDTFPTDIKYFDLPYVVISDEGCVLHSGTKEEILKVCTDTSGYYDKCELEARKHDIYLANNIVITNTKANNLTEAQQVRADRLKIVIEELLALEQSLPREEDKDSAYTLAKAVRNEYKALTGKTIDISINSQDEVDYYECKADKNYDECRGY